MERYQKRSTRRGTLLYKTVPDSDRLYRCAASLPLEFHRHRRWYNYRRQATLPAVSAGSEVHCQVDVTIPVSDGYFNERSRMLKELSYRTNWLSANFTQLNGSAAPTSTDCGVSRDKRVPAIHDRIGGNEVAKKEGPGKQPKLVHGFRCLRSVLANTDESSGGSSTHGPLAGNDAGFRSEQREQ